MKKYFLNNLPFIGLFLFVTFNVIAMLYYPGGSIFDRDKVGYDFTRNFLSQLGRVNAYITDSGGNQISNSFSFVVWSTGMSLTGIIFFVYYLCLPSIFNKSILSYVGSFFAIIASICFVLTGITPGDLTIHLIDQNNDVTILSMLEIHAFFANNIFYFAFPSAIIYSYIIYKSDEINNIYGIGYYIFSFFIFCYILLLVFSPSPFGSEYIITIHVVSQKLIAISWILSTLFLSIGIRNSFK